VLSSSDESDVDNTDEMPLCALRLDSLGSGTSSFEEVLGFGRIWGGGGAVRAARDMGCLVVVESWAGGGRSNESFVGEGVDERLPPMWR
jgi:hypothetical protein